MRPDSGSGGQGPHEDLIDLKESRTMADLWERVKKTVGEIYTQASGKAVEGVSLGVKKIDEASIRRELSKEFAGLGGRTYQLLKREEADDLGTDATVKHHMARLEELELRLEEKEREIAEIRKAGEHQETDADSSDTEEVPKLSAETADPPPSDETPADESDPPRN
jgi:hypothetical protein